MSEKIVALTLRDNLAEETVGIYSRSLKPGAAFDFSTEEKTIEVTFPGSAGSPFVDPGPFRVLPGQRAARRVADDASGEFLLEITPPEFTLSTSVREGGQATTGIHVDRDLGVILVERVPWDTSRLVLVIQNLSTVQAELSLTLKNSEGRRVGQPRQRTFAPGQIEEIPFDHLQPGYRVHLQLVSSLRPEPEPGSAPLQTGGTRLGDIIVEGP